jgi:hypothetical protein
MNQQPYDRLLVFSVGGEVAAALFDIRYLFFGYTKRETTASRNMLMLDRHNKEMV